MHACWVAGGEDWQAGSRLLGEAQQHHWLCTLLMG
jgi:hypothetical protein